MIQIEILAINITIEIDRQQRNDEKCDGGAEQNLPAAVSSDPQKQREPKQIEEMRFDRDDR